MLLAAAFYAGSVAVEREQAALAGVLLLAVFVLMCAILLLGFFDLKLTYKLRSSEEDENQDLK